MGYLKTKPLRIPWNTYKDLYEIHMEIHWNTKNPYEHNKHETYQKANNEQQKNRTKILTKHPPLDRGVGG